MNRVECRGSFMAHPRDSDGRTAGGSLRILGRNLERVVCQCAGFCLMGDALPGQALKFKPTVTSLVGSGRANTQAAEEALEPSSRGVLSGGGGVGVYGRVVRAAIHLFTTLHLSTLHLSEHQESGRTAAIARSARSSTIASRATSSIGDGRRGRSGAFEGCWTLSRFQPEC